MLTTAPPPRGERGSVLMLVPAAVLVLFVLGAIAVDFSIAFLAQRELSAAAAAAANDAAGASVSDDAFFSGGEPGRIVLDAVEADAIADAAVAARRVQGVHGVSTNTDVAGDRVCVTVTGQVDYIFAKAIPGAARGRTVTGQAVATALRSDGSPAGVVTGDVCGG